MPLLRYGGTLFMQTPFTEVVREFNEIFVESARLNVRSYDIKEKSQVAGGSVNSHYINCNSNK